MSKALKIMYHNVLSNPGHEAEQIDYYHALHATYAPDLMFLTELREELVGELAPVKYTVDFNGAINDRRHGWEGIAVVSRLNRDEIDIRRQQSWTGKPVNNSLRYDARELVRVEMPSKIGRLAVYAGHIFHPHHLHYPSFGATRPKQWRFLRDILAEEGLPYAYLADTNTIFARSVRNGLEHDVSRAVLLPHTGDGPQQTWKPVGPLTNMLRNSVGLVIPDMLYLDRAAVSEDIAAMSTLETIPSIVDGIKNPSDHRPILLTIGSSL